jgi:methionyl-tRNA formyltransferase
LPLPGRTIAAAAGYNEPPRDADAYSRPIGPIFVRVRVVVACGDGLLQRALCARLAAEHLLAGIVVYAPRRPKGSWASRLRRHLFPFAPLRYLRTRRLIDRYESAVQPLNERLFFINGQPPRFPPGVEVIRVENVNQPQAVDFIGNAAADVLCVNGTNLLRQPLLDLLSRLPHGIINLHTGLSPYSRGGNCNLFMLLEGHPELVGLTIHHIDVGIDSGDIIITARPDLAADDTYESIEAKVFRLGIDLMLVALRQVAEGRAERVPQWEPGKLFLRRTGYIYDPTLRVRANRLIEAGMLREYLSHQSESDAGVRLVGTTN